ncbi:hypothetical protein DLJ61_17730 [Gordonia terrae]|uniref:DUF4234 domain-containing protein n=2 Tax=Gordonia terrae TaxID=2055 RepID=A0AAD0P0E7_9ACTN|nr:hypothetical protein DLJ61_17730 [Gordonia terrae]
MCPSIRSITPTEHSQSGRPRVAPHYYSVGPDQLSHCGLRKSIGDAHRRPAESISALSRTDEIETSRDGRKSPLNMLGRLFPPLENGATVTHFPGQPVPVIRKQGAWTLWWLTVITCGVYYFIWYDRINSELATATGDARTAWTQWWSQLIPFYGLVGLHHTAQRLNEAHTAAGSTTQVSPLVTWFWAPAWFGSQTRYLQRRLNTLADVQAAGRVTEPRAA